MPVPETERFRCENPHPDHDCDKSVKVNLYGPRSTPRVGVSGFLGMREGMEDNIMLSPESCRNLARDLLAVARYVEEIQD